MNIAIRTGRPAPVGLIRPVIQDSTYHSRMASATMLAGVPTPPIGANTRLDGMSMSRIRKNVSSVTEPNLGLPCSGCRLVFTWP